MKILGLSIAIIYLLTACTASGDADRTMSVGKRFESQLSTDESDEYLLDLKKDDFVYAEFDQLSVDVLVTVYNPRDEIVETFDASHMGIEPIHVDAEMEGIHRFVVEPAGEHAGEYRFEMQRHEPVAETPEQRLDQLLATFEGSDRPGAVVAVVKEGQVIHSQAVGMSNLAFAVPFTRETVSNIGSVSKQFTAMAVTMLAMNGDLSLDDDVRKHFPELPDLGHTVTVRNLLNHTSGYREFLNLLYMAGVLIDQGDYIDRDEIILILQRQPELQEKPGSKFNYNNTAYSLAALLVERVSGEPFQVWMKENIFEPLQMDSTRVRSHLGEIIPNAAEGYYASD